MLNQGHDGYLALAVVTNGPDIIRRDYRDTIEVVKARARVRTGDDAPLLPIPLFGKRERLCAIGGSEVDASGPDLIGASYTYYRIKVATSSKCRVGNDAPRRAIPMLSKCLPAADARVILTNCPGVGRRYGCHCRQ